MSARDQGGGLKPVIGIVCCNEYAGRPIQAVASRFIDPLATLSEAIVLLVPALSDNFEARSVAWRLDGLLLTGSRSHVAPRRYGGTGAVSGAVDEQRDEVALSLAACMIERGRPVFGICRGMQELNVLFGGTLSDLSGHHAGKSEDDLEALFGHRHDVDLMRGGRLADLAGRARISVNSVHQQGIERVGAGLHVEAVSVADGLVEAVASRPCGAEVLGVQWHPEWDVPGCATSNALFAHIGAALRGASVPAPSSRPPASQGGSPCPTIV
jgi:putative glutamine amidotransferase